MNLRYVYLSHHIVAVLKLNTLLHCRIFHTLWAVPVDGEPIWSLTQDESSCHLLAFTWLNCTSDITLHCVSNREIFIHENLTVATRNKMWKFCDISSVDLQINCTTHLLSVSQCDELQNTTLIHVVMSLKGNTTGGKWLSAW